MRPLASLLFKVCIAVSIVTCGELISGCSQTATQAEPQTAVAPTVTFIGQWGVKGDGPGRLQEPASIATDVLGNVYIADAGSQFIHKFDPQGTPLLSFQEDPLKHPQWITVDPDGDVYVSDPVRGSVFVFYPGGERDIHRELHLKTRPGKEGFVSIAVGADELIHVLDSKSGKVDTYSSRFRFQRSWTPPTNSGSGTHPGPIVIGPDGYLYIADERGSRIMRFTAEGQFASEINTSSNGAGKLSAQFTVSRTCIFAMDADGRVLHVWTIDGKPKLDVDLAPQLGQGARPAPGLAMSPREELLVLDQPEARVLRYRVNF
ncbi:MAG: NHL repeat-containing protein [Candidatus Acidiferrales bacterium]